MVSTHIRASVFWFGWLTLGGMCACSSKPSIPGSDGGVGGSAEGGATAINPSDSGTPPNSRFNASATDASNPQTCGGSKIAAEPRKVNVVVLLDRSLSMNTPLSATETKTRWQAMGAALNGAMSAVQDKIAFGLKLFPDSIADCAVTQSGLAVEMGLGAETVAQIDKVIANAIPAGGTPVTLALQQVAGYFSSVDAGSLEGDKVVLLATDGAPNCNGQLTCAQSACIANIENPAQTIDVCQFAPEQCLDSIAAIKAVEDLESQGIHTVIVGIPGSDYPQYRDVLNQMGTAGGLPNPDPNYDYYPVSADAGLTGLQATLVNITKGLIHSCNLQLTSSPQNTGLLNVSVDGTKIAQAGPDGWQVDASTSPPTIVIKGATCERIETQGAESVEVIYGCPTVIY